ncbi:hypothetical protein BVZ89_00175 [Haemophilus influenzae]|nr:hypothetical protein BVZ79_01135 [Haemophilus influenzae]PRI62664.1 hypothetical protein BVZ80_01361 [Haemophilus influenzae]PRI67917.1 hypothetical protein BVZ89_00175 [Haemophilus influenzae]PRJ90919.1 hypothetical protein BV168_00973 [Haemophilus influenzae]PRJ92769.1 hypothetical protein BV169_00956 [Haemophilus influenzae]
MLELILLLLIAMIFIAVIVVVLDWFIGDEWWFDE